VTTTDAIHTCVQNAERQVRRFFQRIQWTPLLLVVSMFACENTHSVVLGLLYRLLAALKRQHCLDNTFTSIGIWSLRPLACKQAH